MKRPLCGHGGREARRFPSLHHWGRLGERGASGAFPWLPPGGSSRRSRVKEPAVPDCYYISRKKRMACMLRAEHFQCLFLSQDVSLGLRGLLPSAYGRHLPPGGRLGGRGTVSTPASLIEGGGTRSVTEGVRLLLLAKRRCYTFVKNTAEEIGFITALTVFFVI